MQYMWTFRVNTAEQGEIVDKVPAETERMARLMVEEEVYSNGYTLLELEIIDSVVVG
jgi:hypothetical protein